MVSIDVSPAAPTTTPPRMDLPTPAFVTAENGSPDAQLAALVVQQQLSHDFLLGLVKAVKNNEDTIKDLTTEIGGCKAASLQLRRDLFAVRGTLS